MPTVARRSLRAKLTAVLKPEVPKDLYLVIDHPQQNDILTGPEYVVRLGTAKEKHVEISVNKGPWESCRPAAGYWWYDWKLTAPGKQTLVARMLTVDGKYKKSPIRTCVYKPL